MLTANPSPLVRYGAAIATAALALGLTLLLQPLLNQTVTAFFFGAVMVSAWYGGLGPGLLATALAVLALDDFFLPPFESLHLDLHSILQLSVFALVAVVISSLTAARKRAEEALRQAHDELEFRVQDRTAQLSSANAQLQAEIAEREEAQRRVSEVSRKLADQNRELLRLEREMGRVAPLAALGRITGTLAHELGTPLNSVLGYTQLLVEEDVPDSAREILHIIESQVQRVVEIIQHYLSHTRDSIQDLQSVDINELINDTLVLLKPVFQQHQIHVTTDLIEPVPSVQADSGSLQRVLMNLLNNAVDAMHAGGTVNVSSRVSTSPQTARAGICIEVQDTGIGIPADKLSTVFELFATTKAPGKGTGLGLGICQEIVKAHGGTIEIRSQEGQGTCVQVFLPTQEDDSPVPVEESR